MSQVSAKTMYVSCIARSESGNVLNIFLFFFFFGGGGGGCEFYYSVYKDYEEIALQHCYIFKSSVPVPSEATVGVYCNCTNFVK